MASQSKRFKKSKKNKRTTKKSNLRKRKFRGGRLFKTKVTEPDTNPYKEGGVIDLLPFIKKLHNISDDDSTDVKNLYYVITKYIKNENEDKNSVVLVCIDKESMDKTINLINESSIHSKLIKKESELLKLKTDINVIDVQNNGIEIKKKFCLFFENYKQKGGIKEGYDDVEKKKVKNSDRVGYYGYLDNIEDQKEKKEIEEQKNNVIQKIKDKMDKCFNSPSFDDNDKNELIRLFENAKTVDPTKTNSLIKYIQEILIPSAKTNIANTETNNVNLNVKLTTEIEKLKTEIEKLKTENELLQPEFDKIENDKTKLLPSRVRSINVKILKQYITEIHNNNDNIKYINTVGNLVIYNNEEYIIKRIEKSFFTSYKQYFIEQKNTRSASPSVYYIDLNDYYICELSDINAKQILSNTKN